MGMPKYDQTWVDQDQKDADVTPSFQQPMQAGQSCDVMRAIQKSLSNARKADQRVRKLLQDKQLKEAQWKKFGKEMKDNNEKEFRKYTKDLEKIDDDMEHVLQQGQEATELVKKLATQGLAALQRPAPMEEDGRSSWDELLAAKVPCSPDVDDGFLREALKAAAQATGMHTVTHRQLPDPGWTLDKKVQGAVQLQGRPAFSENCLRVGFAAVLECTAPSECPHCWQSWHHCGCWHACDASGCLS